MAEYDSVANETEIIVPAKGAQFTVAGSLVNADGTVDLSFLFAM